MRLKMHALAPLVVLAMSCATTPPLVPQPSTMVTSGGVKVDLEIEDDALAIQIWNQSPKPLSVMPSAIKVHKDRQFFTPNESELARTLPPGIKLPLRLRYELDGTRLGDAEGALVYIDSAISQDGQRVALAPFQLVKNPAVENLLTGPHISVGGGYGFSHFYSTNVHSGFAELRFGGLVEAAEMTGRFRVQIGQSEAGLTVLKPSLAFGVLWRLGQRVKLGFEFSSLPPVSFIMVQRSTGPTYIRELAFEASPELRIDLVRGQAQTLFLSLRPGVSFGLTGRPSFVSPNMLVGIGYGYEKLKPEYGARYRRVSATAR